MPNPTLEITEVQMKDGSKKLKFTSPFHPALPKRLGDLGGKWSATAKAWYLPNDLTPQLRQLCIDVFAIDPLDPNPPDLVNVQIHYSDDGYRNESYWLFGREILRRPERDTNVKPGAGVSILSGGFAGTGGSRHNPHIGYSKDDTVILIRDVPRLAAESYRLEQPEGAVVVIERQPGGSR